MEDVNDWRLSTDKGIPYRLFEDSPGGSFSEESSDATEIYIIQTSRLDDFISESFPDPAVVLGEGWLFQKKRKMPGPNLLYTSKVSYDAFPKGKPLDPWENDEDAPSDTYAEFVKVTINYATDKDQGNKEDNDPDNEDNEDFFQVSAQASGEFFTLPTRGLKWEISKNDRSKDVDIKDPLVPNSIIIPEVEYTVTYPSLTPWMAKVLVHRYRRCMGAVNNKPLAVFQNAPAETILCLGFSYNYKNTWRKGDVKIDFEGRFWEKSPEPGIGHNHVWRAGHGWTRIRKPNEKLIHRIGSFVPLFFSGPVPDDPKPERAEDHIDWEALALDTDEIWGDTG